MKTNVIALVALLSGVNFASAQEPPKMPAPAPEHAWLQKFVGDWDSQVEVEMEPGKPPVVSKGTEKARMIGGFWMTSEGKAEMMGMPFNFVLTLGYDPEKKKYIGTWVDSMNSYLWKYEGTVDPTGKILTLETEGPCPMEPGKIFAFKEITEFKSDDHRTFTSTMKGSDGKWTTLMKGESKRKK